MVVWQPRFGKHPEQVINSHATTNTTIVVPQQIHINARCLVLQYSAQDISASYPHSLSSAEQKILSGMLSVLDLPANDIMQATIYATNPDLVAINAQIAPWRSKYILQLNMELPEVTEHNCIRTFSPGYLLHNPQYKSQAYKTLLNLRAMLHGGT